MSTNSAVLPRGRSAPPAPRDIPQHVSPELLARLLEVAGQTAPDEPGTMIP